MTFDKGIVNLTKMAVNWGGNSVEKLRFMDLGDASLFEYIAERARNLKSLCLTKCTFSGAIAEALGRLKQLEELEVVRCSACPGLIMKVIGAECPQLKRLKLKSIVICGTSIGQEGFPICLGIPEIMLQLEYLQLIRTCTINEELMKILERCPNLKKLDLRGSTKETVEFDDVLVRCTKIRTVILTYDEFFDKIYGYDYNYDYDDDDYPAYGYCSGDHCCAYCSQYHYCDY